MVNEKWYIKDSPWFGNSSKHGNSDKSNEKNDLCSLGQHLSGTDSKHRLGLGTLTEHPNAATQGSICVPKNLDIAHGFNITVFHHV